MLVHAEDFLHHQDHREIRAPRRLGAVGGHAPVAGGHLDFAGVEAGRVGVDGALRHHRLHRQSEASAQRGDQETTPVHRQGRRHERIEFGLQGIGGGVRGCSCGGLLFVRAGAKAS
ncbi:MAG: hypothetical protein FD132_2570 [bacterium]|nr:MAG: hypothetical protein FD132_2570 [bacterium]